MSDHTAGGSRRAGGASRRAAARGNRPEAATGAEVGSPDDGWPRVGRIVNPDDPPTLPLNAPEPTAPAPPDAAELYRDLVATFNRLLDLIRPEAVAPPLAVDRRVPEAARPARHLAYVHGIGPHEPGFCRPWWGALEPFAPGLRPGVLATTTEPPDGNIHEVLWSDLVNRTRPAGARPGPELNEPDDQAEELAAAIRDEIEDRQDRMMADGGRDTDIVPPPSTRIEEGMPGLAGIDDFVRYMLRRSVRERVLARFLAPLRSLLAQGFQVDVIAHSWGTVVAYEGLRRLDAEPGLADGSVRSFVTVGAALALGAVRRNVQGRLGEARRPRLVARWLNLAARGDVVGGPLARRFPDVEDHVGLPAVGCRPLDPVGAHACYFDPANVLVQRDLIGAALLG